MLENRSRTRSTTPCDNGHHPAESRQGTTTTGGATQRAASFAGPWPAVGSGRPSIGSWESGGRGAASAARRWVLGSVLLLGIFAFVPTALGSTTPDPTFGINGIARSDPAQAQPDARLTGVFGTPTGGVFTVGWNGSGSGGPGMVCRFQPNGYPDVAIGPSGCYHLAPPGHPSLFVESSVGAFHGSVLLATRLLPVTQQAIGVARLNPDGTLDTSFGVNGWVIVPRRRASDQIGVAAFALPSGRTLVVDPSSANTDLIRLNPDGQVDATFGTGGRSTLPGFDRAMPDASGRIYVMPNDNATLCGCYSSHTLQISRLTPSGAPDAQFDSNTPTIIGSGAMLSQYMGFQPGGRLIVGYDDSNAAPDGSDAYRAFRRIGNDGGFDPTFGNDGTATLPKNPYGHDAAAMDASGRILAANDVATSQLPYPNQTDGVRVDRLDADGHTDPSFGTNGTQIETWTQDYEQTAALLQGETGDAVTVAGAAGAKTPNDPPVAHSLTYDLVFRLLAAGPPPSSSPLVVTTGAATELTATTASLTGTVNPNGNTTYGCVFLLSPSPNGPVPCSQSSSSGNLTVGITGHATGLQPGTSYAFQLAISDHDGETKGEIQTFTTPALPHEPVVLITGLDDPTSGQHAGERCDVGSMAAICHLLTDAGFPVYVVPSATGGPVIDNHGGVDDNAARFASYLASQIEPVAGTPIPPLIIGHSMGGLIARTAISRYGAAPAGLFTIATPFDGSFGADILEGALFFPPLAGAARYAAAHFGRAAVDDLTSLARAWDNASLEPPNVPLWTFAGTACHGIGAGYLFPNDGIVGRSSAWGIHANLGVTTQDSYDDWHVDTVRKTFASRGCKLVTGNNPVELDDGYVHNAVLAVAQQLRASALRVTARGRRQARTRPVMQTHLRSTPLVQPKQLRLPLTTGTTQMRHPGTTLPIATGGAVLAREPFSISCDGKILPALPALGSGVYGFAGVTPSCHRATLIGKRAVMIGVTKNSAHATAIITQREGNTVQVDIAAHATIRHLTFSRSDHSVHVHVRRYGRRHVRCRTTKSRLGGLVVSASIGGRRYQAIIPALS